jgi:hypothetical protein
MNSAPQTGTPSVIRWFYRRVFRGYEWIVIAGLLTGLYFFFKGGIAR